MNNVNEVLEAIKMLSSKEKLEFDKEYQVLIKELKDEEKKRKEEARKKKEEENIKKASVIGDKICELLDVNGFPYHGVFQACDCPYELCESDWGDLYNYCEMIEDVTDETWKQVNSLMNDFLKLVPKSYYMDKEAGQGYFDDTYCDVYLKGGRFDEMIETDNKLFE